VIGSPSRSNHTPIPAASVIGSGFGTRQPVVPSRASAVGECRKAKRSASTRVHGGRTGLQLYTVRSVISTDSTLILSLLTPPEGQ